MDDFSSSTTHFATVSIMLLIKIYGDDAISDKILSICFGLSTERKHEDECTDTDLIVILSMKYDLVSCRSNLTKQCHFR